MKRAGIRGSTRLRVSITAVGVAAVLGGTGALVFPTAANASDTAHTLKFTASRRIQSPSPRRQTRWPITTSTVRARLSVSTCCPSCSTRRRKPRRPASRWPPAAACSTARSLSPAARDTAPLPAGPGASPERPARSRPEISTRAAPGRPSRSPTPRKSARWAVTAGLALRPASGPRLTGRESVSTSPPPRSRATCSRTWIRVVLQNEFVFHDAAPEPRSRRLGARS
jgi:hypothetical protein